MQSMINKVGEKHAGFHIHFNEAVVLQKWVTLKTVNKYMIEHFSKMVRC